MINISMVHLLFMFYKQNHTFIIKCKIYIINKVNHTDEQKQVTLSGTTYT